jgi:transposase
MTVKKRSVHVVRIEREYKGKTYKSAVLRHSYREGGKVKNVTVANLSDLPDEAVDALQRALRGKTLVDLENLRVVRSLPHGHVRAVLDVVDRLDLPRLLAAKTCPDRDLVVAMVAARILSPATKLATTRLWHASTLARECGVENAGEDDLYRAMDWLYRRKDAVERGLAGRHLRDGCLVLYDLTSSYFEGTHCPLAARGHNRDGKKGKLQVNYGILTDRRGCPVAASVFKGNTADPDTFLPQIDALRKRFGISSVVVVGDRGMIAQKQIDAMRGVDGVKWITALRSGAIRKLIDQKEIQLGLFDERNLYEFTHRDFPGERLVACRNPELGRLRAHKRQSMLDATVRELERIQKSVGSGRLRGVDAIGVRVGRVIGKYKMAKHIVLHIEERAFRWEIDRENVAAEASLDGIYVIRTGVEQTVMDGPETVRQYKRLADVERAFRTIKTVDLHVRPIHHWKPERVVAHIFLCMLAYYVEWHMREAWRPLMFSDEDQAAKETRDPVAPARRSKAALAKIAARRTGDGHLVHDFRSLLNSLSTIVVSTHVIDHQESPANTFDITTTPDDHQRQALALLADLRP